MSAPDSIGARLRSLLPRYLWQNDDGTLVSLVDAIGEQYESLQGQVASLYEDLFLETCDERLLPYFALQLGIDGIADLAIDGLSVRPWLGQAVALRQGKGTLAALENACHAVSGWVVTAQPGQMSVARTQTLRHLQLDRGRLLDLEEQATGLTPARTVAVTGPGRLPHPQHTGPRNLGRGPGPLLVELSVFRLHTYPVQGRLPTPAGPGAAGRTSFTFHPFGVDTPLYLDPAASPVPTPVSRSDLRRALAGARPTLPFRIGPASGTANVRIAAADLRRWELPSSADDPDVFVDPELGRMMWQHTAPQGITVDYSYCFSAFLGGGPYTLDSQWQQHQPETLLHVRQSAPSPPRDPLFQTLEAALSYATAHNDPPRSWNIQFEDNGTYQPPDGEAWRLDIRPGSSISLTTLPGQVPLLKGDLRPTLISSAESPPQPPAVLAVFGVLVDGQVALAGDGNVTLDNVTLNPHKRPSLDANTGADGSLQVNINKAIVGPISTGPGVTVVVTDSIVDGGGGTAVNASASVDLQRVTVLGTVQGDPLVSEQSLHVSWGQPQLRLPTTGVLRNCYVRTESRHFRPEAHAPVDLSDESAVSNLFQSVLGPVFTSTRYGEPGYCQLSLNCDPLLHAGGAEGAELGVFSWLQQPTRAARLEQVAQDFVPAGLEATITYCT